MKLTSREAREQSRNYTCIVGDIPIHNIEGLCMDSRPCRYKVFDDINGLIRCDYSQQTKPCQNTPKEHLSLIHPSSDGGDKDKTADTPSKLPSYKVRQ